MNYRRTNVITAILPMAVIGLGLLASGCCTKRDVAEINDRLSRIEAQGRQTQELTSRMDTLITQAVEANRQLQNDVRYSSDELNRQMTQLMENYADLLSRIDRLSSQQVIKLPLKDSPGVQADIPSGEATTPPEGTQSSAECVDMYDNAFTQVRRGEYEPAINGFRTFLAQCPNHKDVENAYYWIGECYYSQEQYTQAIAEYEHLLKTYPDSPNVARALYKLARCKQEIGKKSEARELFQKLVKEHGGTLEAEQAAQRLKDL